MILRLSTRRSSAGGTQIGRRFGSAGIWYQQIPDSVLLYQAFLGESRLGVMPGKVSLERVPVNLRLPKVIVAAIERIMPAEGFPTRQAFIEQAIREKVDRWKSAGGRIPEDPGPAGLVEEVRQGSGPGGRRRAP